MNVMSIDNTLVIGATGKTGRRVAARLRLAGTPDRQPRSFEDYVVRTAATGAWQR
jgi:uncharacterized protein YbjT (DUF2867 family)